MSKTDTARARTSPTIGHTGGPPLQDNDRQTPLQSPLLKLKEACAYLGVGITTIYKLMGNGEIEVVRLTADPRITRRSCDALIERRTTRATPPSPPPARRGRGRPRKHQRPRSEDQPAGAP